MKNKLIVILTVTLTLFSQNLAFADSIDDQMNEMTLRYGSLSSAMLDSYAHKQGKAMASFLLGNPGQLSNLTGISSNDPRLSSLINQLGTSASSSDLDKILSDNGLTLTSNAYTSVNNAALEINAKAKTLDASVVQAGIAWTNNMVSLLAPTLVTPQTPTLDNSQVTGMPSEGLVFGMFTNRALNAFVRQYPDVFSQVSASGVGTAAQMEAWNSAITVAMKASKSDFSKMLPSSCADAFLSGMSGTSSITGNCSACNTAGLLANSQLQLIFNPKSVLPSSTTNLSPTDIANLSPVQKAALASQNGDISQLLGSGTTPSCSGASGAVQSNVDSTLPSVLNFLGGK